jgi:hypothetical protein
MKLYLNEKQRNVVLEILRASENNATEGKDAELALQFQYLYNKIKPTNAAYVSLNRDEAEAIVEFCEIVRKSLDTAMDFINTKSDKSEEEKEELRKETTGYLGEVNDVINQLQDKIRNNPV